MCCVLVLPCAVQGARSPWYAHIPCSSMCHLWNPCKTSGPYPISRRAPQGTAIRRSKPLWLTRWTRPPASLAAETLCRCLSVDTWYSEKHGELSSVTCTRLRVLNQLRCRNRFLGQRTLPKSGVVTQASSPSPGRTYCGEGRTFGGRLVPALRLWGAVCAPCSPPVRGIRQ